MCVIAVAKTAPLSRDTLTACAEANPDGIGVAWLYGGYVHWSKGHTDVTKLFDFIESLPLPYIFHARIRTVGRDSQELTHPFPLGGSLALSGKNRRGVLFHNGHWSRWDDIVMTAMLSLPSSKIPSGHQWSDSRAMAWLAGRYGDKILPFIARDQKVALLKRDGPELWGSGWVHREGVSFSNTSHETRAVVAVEKVNGTGYFGPSPRSYAPRWPSDGRTRPEWITKRVADMTNEEYAQYHMYINGAD